MQNPQPVWAWTDSLAVLIGISAMLGEWIADRQLANFAPILTTRVAFVRIIYGATHATRTIF